MTRPGPLDHQQPCIERGCPNPSLMPESEYCAYHARRQPPAATDGPAADPIADLCARLRDEYEGCPSPVTTARVATLREAADALERLRVERDEAERDTLRKCVRAADAMRAGLHQLMARYRGHSRRT